MVKYIGMRGTGGEVWVDKGSFALTPDKSFRYRNHSPDGFEWGYGGSGPAQLALAILLEETGPDEACSYYQTFKFQIVAAFPKQGWELSSQQVQNWLEKQRIINPLTPIDDDRR